MTEKGFRGFFRNHPYEHNIADAEKNEIMKVTSCGFGDDHTSIIMIKDGIVKIYACTADEEDADSVLAVPVSSIESITIPESGRPCWQFWLAGGGVFQLGQFPRQETPCRQI